MKVICDGILMGHQCENRKCKHRKPHKTQKGCNKRTHNNADRWCECPGTISPLDGHADGALVTCLPECCAEAIEIKKKQARNLDRYVGKESQ